MRPLSAWTVDTSELGTSDRSGTLRLSPARCLTRRDMRRALLLYAMAALKRRVQRGLALRHSGSGTHRRAPQALGTEAIASASLAVRSPPASKSSAERP